MAALILDLNRLVNAAGALLFVLVGLFAFATAKGALRARLVGAAAVALGAPLVAGNLLETTDGVLVGLAAMYVVTTACATLLALHLALAARRRGVFAAVGALLVLGTAVSMGVSFATEGATFAPLVFSLSFSLAMGALGLVVAAAGARVRDLDADDAAPGGGRDLALVALAFGAYPLFILAPSRTDLPDATGWAAILVAAASWMLVLGAPSRAARRSALVAWLGLAAVALVGLVFWGPLQSLDARVNAVGAPGMVRMLAVTALAFAILRHDLLGVPLPSVTVRRGPLAAAGLATLFIVAQLAQNFLSERYSLLTGILASALVFVSGPIQRAFYGKLSASERVAKNEDVYRKALRVALKDRVITREEEAHLHELAEALGITGARAHVLLSEVEAELRAR